MTDLGLSHLFAKVEAHAKASRATTKANGDCACPYQKSICAIAAISFDFGSLYHPPYSTRSIST